MDIDKYLTVNRDKEFIYSGKRHYSIHKIPNVPIGNDGFFITKSRPDWYIDSKKRLKGFCLYCGCELPKRKRSYCSDDCKWNCKCAIGDLQVTSLRRYVHQFFIFECQDCGCHFSRLTPAKIELPEHWGEVHHKIPLEYGGSDTFDNLILLCKDCHKLRHKKIVRS